ncbi:inositol polyphosphate 1-phosphatase [Pectinophora gossypiella]|uniref:inositol polyphosphate 1-phosphatase n=1 Tax=Pectinophora gossypiella TaxID=13191 RepID=UPI00214E7042|nr:inositol polyphosphate 1-phosphatase [Pectinophora gossypiella]
MEDILKALICASERAASVAKSCCIGAAKDSLLVAEKGEGEANARFDKDFKTIADVLAQESARYEIALRCPDLAKQLRGEECAEIGGVTIKLCESEEKTAELLSSLVPLQAAKRMAEAAHGEIKVTLNNPPVHVADINPCDLGVWIDPIDATAEFIAGVRGEADADRGLPCVTVLIGAYLRSTGEPIVGVINQPFYSGGKGRIIWGVSYGKTRKWSEGDTSKHSIDKTVLISGAENPAIVKKFKACGWEVKSVPGAGHKLLKVAIGEAAAYIVSKGSTFRWDTCAPHAILRAQGGDLLCYTTHKPVTYNDPMECDTQQYANSGGIIAYTNTKVLEDLKKILN